MRNRLLLISIAAILTAPIAMYAQTPAAKPAFDVASVRPSPAPDMQKMMADLQVGKKPESAHVEGSRAAYTYMSLKQLIAYAYKMRAYEINGPDWLVTDRFDIVARLPEGSSKDAAPDMMRTLLEDRFRLTVHREKQDQPVLALVVAKGGPKLKEAAAASVPIDESVPLKPGESIIDAIDGPIRVTKNGDGSTTYNMGARGAFKLKFDGETLSMHMEASSISMKGFAVMINTLGGGEGRQVVDQTGLMGNYQAAVDFALTDLVSSLHDQGIEIPTGPPGGGPGGATDPEGGATVSAALEKLGLKLEKGRAPVDRLVVDQVEKSPTEN
jgi:uncharacterized protein (TIGR03435 family)